MANYVTLLKATLFTDPKIEHSEEHHEIKQLSSPFTQHMWQYATVGMGIYRVKCSDSLAVSKELSADSPSSSCVQDFLSVYGVYQSVC